MQMDAGSLETKLLFVLVGVRSFLAAGVPGLPGLYQLQRPKRRKRYSSAPGHHYHPARAVKQGRNMCGNGLPAGNPATRSSQAGKMCG